MNFDPHSVVKVPFPFTDRHAQKQRPALILSTGDFGKRSGHSVMAMITSAKHSAWPLDIEITDLAAAGLPSPCLVRMKLFTLDHRLVLGQIGRLSAQDRQSVSEALSLLLS
ncbi:MAG: type II toxin-antitoxin system PemK/MazF family toxin [Wenzhouxiangella sp.]